ncbi:protein kinase [Penicillium manginii]|uniref:protein kinase n=1 Tax=Penicillium manginii TaxID=203109 RepID=UPI0025487667|nr:protein kinase [Penicillium manginii]KAJ5755267.1 protein kinase [Penicillium manginii]
MAIPCMILSRTIPLRSISPLRITSRTMSSHSNSSQMDQNLYISTIDAEPLQRYRQGGYHPVTLGKCLKFGRYKVLHKLGWGGYSTVWAARDQRLCKLVEQTYIAVKISVAEREHNGDTQELQTLKLLASHQPLPNHTVHMLDHFDLKGPNGSHKCLVYELLGPNVPDIIDASFPDGRLPGKLAKIIAKQCLIGLDSLHQLKIGHGDLHTRNLAFAMPHIDNLTEEKFIEILGKPEVGYVQKRDGKFLEAGVPEYVVRPASYGNNSWILAQDVKIIDFGESFLHTAPPRNTTYTFISPGTGSYISRSH